MRLNGDHNTWESDTWPTSPEQATELAYAQSCAYAHVKGFCILPDTLVMETNEVIQALACERDELAEEALAHDKYKELYQQLMVDLHTLLKRADKSEVIDDLASVVEHSRKQERTQRSYS